MQKIKIDTLIIGGGISGFAAALGAAGKKKNVILIDQSSGFGGASTNANVGTICGAFYRSFTSMRIAGGAFSKYFLDRLDKTDGISKPMLHQDGLYIIPYEWRALQKLYTDLLKAHHVDVRLQTTVQQVEVKGSCITGLTLFNGQTEYKIDCLSVVDCSGNAIVSQLAGVETIKEESYQAASQIFRLMNLTDVTEYALNFSLKRAMLKNSAEKSWPVSYQTLQVVPGSLRNNRVDLKLTMPDLITDTLAATELSQHAERSIEEIMTVLKKDIKSLEQALVETIFPQPGIRVQQRSKGKYILTEQDVLTCQKFDDGIAVGTWPIEEWSNDGKLHMEYFAPDDGYHIPARCLQSLVLENLFFGGKNISATSKAIASARVMGTAWQTGFAAGQLSCAENPSALSQTIEELNRELQ
jgi:2-polyprenyl-6-methoxyphenol hydroxylase-like FAD-dependent oxidoreductase